MPNTVSYPGLKVASGGTAIEKYRLFELDATNNYPNVQATSADTDKPLGVTIAKAEANEALVYEKLDGGIYLVTASAAISEGDAIAPAAAGKIATAASGDRDVGQALEAASADGDVIRCVLRDAGLVA